MTADAPDPGEPITLAVALAGCFVRGDDEGMAALIGELPVEAWAGTLGATAALAAILAGLLGEATGTPASRIIEEAALHLARHRAGP
jgi:hypothetical protein